MRSVRLHIAQAIADRIPTENTAPGRAQMKESKMAAKPVRNQQTGKLTGREVGAQELLEMGVEDLSGMAMDDVRVHYKQPKPV